MRQILLSAALGLVLGCQSNWNGVAHEGAPHKLILPEQVKWDENPASLPPGAKLAVLDGDPTTPGFFTIRGWLPDGYRIPPHWHQNAERVTVLSGTMYLGEGDRFDESTARALPAGSYSSMPAGMHHFAYFKSDTVIQLSSLGPWGITYVNADDDPRNAKK